MSDYFYTDVSKEPAGCIKKTTNTILCKWKKNAQHYKHMNYMKYIHRGDTIMAIFKWIKYYLILPTDLYPGAVWSSREIDSNDEYPN